MSRLHNIRIKPGSKQESQFTKLLNSVGVDRSNVHCRLGYLFWTPYDEYILSDGLYRLIEDKIHNISFSR